MAFKSHLEQLGAVKGVAYGGDDEEESDAEEGVARDEEGADLGEVVNDVWEQPSEKTRGARSNKDRERSLCQGQKSLPMCLATS